MTAEGGLHGTIHPDFVAVADRLNEFAALDPTYSAGLCVYHRGEMVIDTWWGSTLGPDDLLPIFSSSKGGAGIVIACLVRDGLLNLDEKVATYWPEFAARGKESIPVRQLLSHQAGLVGPDCGYTIAELYAHTPLAEKLAAQRPHWQPGSAFSYHALTIGVLADELVRRVAGVSLSQYFREHVAEPRTIDLYYGLPPELDDRVIEVQMPTVEELAQHPNAIPMGSRDGLASLYFPSDGVPLWVEVNREPSRRAGAPAVGALGSARGLATTYAALTHEIAGVPRLLDDETIDQVSQQQVWGQQLSDANDMSTGFGIIFQKPSLRHPFGSYQSFGHDGVGGSLAFCDPHHDLAFGYIVQRIPLPGGADQRALRLTRDIRKAASTRGN